MAPLIGALFRPIDKGTALGSHPHFGLLPHLYAILTGHCPIPSI